MSQSESIQRLGLTLSEYAGFQVVETKRVLYLSLVLGHIDLFQLCLEDQETSYSGIKQSDWNKFVAGLWRLSQAWRLAPVSV